MIACVAAGLALVLVMGVTTLKRRASGSERYDPPPAPKRVSGLVDREPDEPVASPAPPQRPAHPLDALRRTVDDVRKRTPAIKRMTRGPEFDRARVAALADLSDARDTLGTYLDAHPSDDRGHALWDRLLALYVALKKI